MEDRRVNWWWAAALALWAGCAGVAGAAGDWASLGPLYSEFKLTLAPGERAEALGPFFYSQQLDTAHTWAVPPLGSYTRDQATDFSEFDLLYPVVTYDRYGKEHRWQVLQLFSFGGGQTQTETNVSRITLFPIFFQQRSPIPEKNYIAVMPFYGHLKNRLFRDEVKFVMLPLYVESRKGEVITDNYVWPFVHVRHGGGVEGWQFWPFYGRETKPLTFHTNIWDDAEPVAGHESRFVLWPIYLSSTAGIGTTNMVHSQALIPFYSMTRSPLRDSTTYLWPFGYTVTDDREKHYHEQDLPWPLVVFAHGEGKTATRIWPFYSQVQTPTAESDFYLWPLYFYKRFHSDPLDRRRTRILFFLYSDVSEHNTETGATLRRQDFWPLFTARRDFEGRSRVQVLAILEPFLPNNKSVERDYAPVYSFWRSEKNPKTGATSQSLLWNLYRRDATPDSKKISLLLGLFQYQSTPNGRHWRLLYIPFGKKGDRGT